MKERAEQLLKKTTQTINQLKPFQKLNCESFDLASLTEIIEKLTNIERSLRNNKICNIDISQKLSERNSHIVNQHLTTLTKLVSAYRNKGSKLINSFYRGLKAERNKILDDRQKIIHFTKGDAKAEKYSATFLNAQTKVQNCLLNEKKDSPTQKIGKMNTLAASVKEANAALKQLTNRTSDLIIEKGKEQSRIHESYEKSYKTYQDLLKTVISKQKDQNDNEVKIEADLLTPLKKAPFTGTNSQEIRTATKECEKRIKQLRSLSIALDINKEKTAREKAAKILRDGIKLHINLIKSQYNKVYKAFYRPSESRKDSSSNGLLYTDPARGLSYEDKDNITAFLNKFDPNKKTNPREPCSTDNLIFSVPNCNCLSLLQNHKGLFATRYINQSKKAKEYLNALACSKDVQSKSGNASALTGLVADFNQKNNVEVSKTLEILFYKCINQPTGQELSKSDVIHAIKDNLHVLTKANLMLCNEALKEKQTQIHAPLLIKAIDYLTGKPQQANEDKEQKNSSQRLAFSDPKKTHLLFILLQRDVAFDVIDRVMGAKLYESTWKNQQFSWEKDEEPNRKRAQKWNSNIGDLIKTYQTNTTVEKETWCRQACFLVAAIASNHNKKLASLNGGWSKWVERGTLSVISSIPIVAEMSGAKEKLEKNEQAVIWQCEHVSRLLSKIIKNTSLQGVLLFENHREHNLSILNVLLSRIKDNQASYLNQLFTSLADRNKDQDAKFALHTRAELINQLDTCITQYEEKEMDTLRTTSMKVYLIESAATILQVGPLHAKRKLLINLARRTFVNQHFWPRLGLDIVLMGLFGLGVLVGVIRLLAGYSSFFFCRAETNRQEAVTKIINNYALKNEAAFFAKTNIIKREAAAENKAVPSSINAEPRQAAAAQQPFCATM